VLIASLRRHPRDVAGLAGWSLVQALPVAASGWVLAEAVGLFLAGRTAGGICWLGLLALAALAGAWGTRQSYHRLGALAEPLRDELVTFIVAGTLARALDTSLPPDTNAIGRLNRQAEIVRDSFAGLLSVAATFIFTAGATIAGVVTLAPGTLPYVVPPLLVSLIVLRLLLRPFAARQRRSVIGEEEVASSAARAVSGLRDVTACGAELPVLAQLDAQVREQAAAARSVARAGSLRLLCVAAGGWLPLLLVLAAAPSMLRRGVPPAHLIGAIAYIGGSLRNVLSALSQGLGAGMVRLTVTLERIIEAAAPTAALAPVERVSFVSGGGFELRGVRFGYSATAEPVIDDLSIDIAAGDHLAIVGPSGIGKSSLAGLLAGLLEPTAGSVLLDGVPAGRCPFSVRVLIPQEAYVFAGPLADNIRYLCPGADLASVEAAVESVGMAPLVARLGGYEAVVSPARLSAGERQLIALARAYLSPAPIVILDEATCHLDPAAEARAEAAFAERGGTLIVIAHRISSALRARRILVLDGTRAQAGSHASLLVSSPLYRDLVGYWNGAALAPPPADNAPLWTEDPCLTEEKESKMTPYFPRGIKFPSK
jgi:ATP-binding cassette, subfamily B, bacterial RamB/AmfA